MDERSARRCFGADAARPRCRLLVRAATGPVFATRQRPAPDAVDLTRRTRRTCRRPPGSRVAVRFKDPAVDREPRVRAVRRRPERDRALPGPRRARPACPRRRRKPPRCRDVCRPARRVRANRGHRGSRVELASSLCVARRPRRNRARGAAGEPAAKATARARPRRNLVEPGEVPAAAPTSADAPAQPPAKKTATRVRRPPRAAGRPPWPEQVRPRPQPAFLVFSVEYTEARRKYKYCGGRLRSRPLRRQPRTAPSGGNSSTAPPAELVLREIPDGASLRLRSAPAVSAAPSEKLRCGSCFFVATTFRA